MQSLPASLDQRDTVVQGRVVSIPESRSRSVRFLFEIDRFPSDQTLQPVTMLTRINWYNPDTMPAVGERWEFTLRLRAPQGFLSPGSFDYETWLFQRGIRATGYVRNPGEAKRLEPAPGVGLGSVRQLTLNKIQALLKEGDAAGAFVPALVLGVRSGVEPEHWRLLRETGTSHLMAISGLHVGLVAGMGFYLGFWLWKFCATCCLRFSAVKAGAVISLSVAVLYAGLAGFSIPTQRALIMLSVLMFAVLAGRSLRPWQGVSIALVLVLLFDTASVLSAGFWLSFLAVAVILLVLDQWRSRPTWQLFVLIQCVISLAFVPLTGWFFGEASLVSPLANLIAVPVVTFFIVPLSLIAAMLVWLWASGAAVVLELVSFLLDGLLFMLRIAADFSWSHVGLPSVSVQSLVLWGLAIVLFAKLSGQKRWLVMLPLGLSFFFSRPVNVQAGHLGIAFLDVGQGLSVVVETSNRVLVYDLGPRFNRYFNTAEAVVIPYLRSRGISVVDTLLISHEDLDHRGALDEFLGEVETTEVVAGVGVVSEQRSVSRCRAGQSWKWDGFDFEILHPEDGFEALNDNDASCVLRVSQAGEGVLLLTGDISREREAALLEGAFSNVNANIMQVPHHGSASSSSAGFIQKVAPRYAVYNVGIGNRWGFPKPEVKQRYQQLGVESLRTDWAGSVLFDYDSETSEYQFTLWRDKVGRFWHRRQIAD